MGNDLDKGSIDGQIEELKKVAKKEGIEVPYDPIVDKAKTGTNFDREGIQRVFEIVKNDDDIDYLLVEKVDRIGRNAPETLYFIYLLQSECEVTILTPTGEHDVGQVQGMLHAGLMSLMAEVQNDIRTSKAKKERIRGFLENKKWNYLSPHIPLGYEKTDDGWLEVDPKEEPIAQDMFRKFVECQEYAKTERYIQKEYGNWTLEGRRVKTLLQNWVYIGKPRVPEEWIIETSFENDLNEPQLNILKGEEDLFHQAQEIIAEKNKKHSTSDEAKDLLNFIEEYSLFSVVQGSESATLLHHCGEPLVKDGTVNLKGGMEKVHRYICPNCEEEVEPDEYYRQWPREPEFDKIRQIQRVVDGDTSLFESDE